MGRNREAPCGPNHSHAHYGTRFFLSCSTCLCPEATWRNAIRFDPRLPGVYISILESITIWFQWNDHFALLWRQKGWIDKLNQRNLFQRTTRKCGKWLKWSVTDAPPAPGWLNSQYLTGLMYPYVGVRSKHLTSSPPTLHTLEWDTDLSDFVQRIHPLV